MPDFSRTGAGLTEALRGQLSILYATLMPTSVSLAIRITRRRRLWWVHKLATIDDDNCRGFVKFRTGDENSAVIVEFVIHPNFPARAPL